MKGPLAILGYVGIFVAILLVIVGLGAMGLFVSAQVGFEPARGFLQAASGTVAASGSPIQPTVEATPSEPEPPTSGVMYPVAEKVVNLADRSALRYLKAQVVLELAPAHEELGKLDAEAYKKKQEELKKELGAKSAKIEDQITSILSSRTAAELITPEGKQGTKDELRERLGEIVAEEYYLLNVYFTQFIIQ